MLESSCMSAVGELIKAELEKRGWSQRQLAVYAEVNNTSISLAISSDVVPTANLLVKIAAGFQMSPIPFLRAAGYLSHTDLFDVEPALQESHAPPAGRTIRIYTDFMAGNPPFAVLEAGGEMEITSELAAAGVEYGFRVRGLEMLGAIPEGAIAWIRPATTVAPGTTALVMVDGNAIVRRYYCENGTVELRPENPSAKTLHLSPDEVQVLGEVIEVSKRLKP